MPTRQDFELQAYALKRLKEQSDEKNNNSPLFLTHYAYLKTRQDCFDLCNQREAHQALKTLITLEGMPELAWLL